MSREELTMMEGFALRLRDESELDGVDRYRSRFLRMIYNANRAKLTKIVDPQRLGMPLTRLLHSFITQRVRKYLRRHDPEELWNVLTEILRRYSTGCGILDSHLLTLFRLLLTRICSS